MPKSQARTKKLVTLAMLAALSYVVMYVGRIPIVMFLKYDPKDVIIAIAGFIYGPLSAVGISMVVSFIEMFTVSDTGPWGLVMNILSTCAFVVPAAMLYRKKRTIRHALGGLVLGVVLMTGIMLLWNYLITPIYLKAPREEIVGMLLPIFAPFNLLKGGLNTALTLLLYQPVSVALRRAKLLPPSETAADPAARRRTTMGVTLLSLVLLATFVLLVLVFMGKL